MVKRRLLGRDGHVRSDLGHDAHAAMDHVFVARGLTAPEERDVVVVIERDQSVRDVRRGCRRRRERDGFPAIDQRQQVASEERRPDVRLVVWKPQNASRTGDDAPSGIACTMTIISAADIGL